MKTALRLLGAILLLALAGAGWLVFRTFPRTRGTVRAGGHAAPVRIETWPELEAYMDGSAGSVGRIMAPLLGVPARHHGGLGRLGQAFSASRPDAQTCPKPTF